MALDSAGVSFASLTAYEARVLIQENSQLIQQFLFKQNTISKGQPDANTLMSRNAHSYVGSRVRSDTQPQLYTTEIIIIVMRLQTFLEKKQWSVKEKNCISLGLCMLTCLGACFSVRLLQWWHQTPTHWQGVSWGGPQPSNQFLKEQSICNQTEMHQKSQLLASDTKFSVDTCAGFYFYCQALLEAHLLSISWSSGGSIRALNSTLTWISMPSRRAILSSISWSWRIPAIQKPEDNLLMLQMHPIMPVY